jgi:hypothetical protein
MLLVTSNITDNNDPYISGPCFSGLFHITFAPIAIIKGFGGIDSAEDTSEDHVICNRIAGSSSRNSRRLKDLRQSAASRGNSTYYIAQSYYREQQP